MPAIPPRKKAGAPGATPPLQCVVTQTYLSAGRFMEGAGLVPSEGIGWAETGRTPSGVNCTYRAGKQDRDERLNCQACSHVGLQQSRREPRPRNDLHREDSKSEPDDPADDTDRKALDDDEGEDARRAPADRRQNAELEG